MSMIFETSKFNVVAHNKPHHDRNNGGHAIVTPKEKFEDRTQMPLDLYDGLMKLVMVVGEAITTVMINKGVDVSRINYQDNGNWSYFPSTKKTPQIHIHLYVRSYSETHPDSDKRFKSFPDALYFPFRGDAPEYYENFKPYSDEDINDFKIEIEKLLASSKYVGVRDLI